MSWQQMAIGVLTGLASTLASMACVAWEMQRSQWQTLQCVRPGMTAAQVRTVLGPPRTVGAGAAPLARAPA